MSGGPAASVRDVAVALALTADVAVGAWAGTEWVARRLEYAAVLGPGIVRLASAGWWATAAVVLAATTVTSMFVVGWRRASGALGIATVACAWLVRRPVVYAPWAILSWHWRFRHGAHLLAIVERGWEIVAIVTVICAVGTVPLFMAGGTRRATPSSQGTAAWDRGTRLAVDRGLVVGWQDRMTRERQH